LPLKPSLPQQGPNEFFEVLGLRLPKYESWEHVPLGIRVLLNDIMRGMATRQYSPGEASLRFFATISQAAPNPADRVSYEDLARLTVTAEEEAQIEAVAEHYLGLMMGIDLEELRKQREAGEQEAQGGESPL